jgi:hypothetical protein
MRESPRNHTPWSLRRQTFPNDISPTESQGLSGIFE